MKLLGIIFLGIAVICIAILVFGFYSTGRIDDMNWIVTGPPIIGSFSLGAGLALLAASRTGKKDK